jgi:hypothetical protein
LDAIDVLKILNEKGYGKENTGLVLNLVHNPVGAFLHGSQCALENEYKKKLSHKYSVTFNNLFCITNMPVEDIWSISLNQEILRTILMSWLQRSTPRPQRMSCAEKP